MNTRTRNGIKSRGDFDPQEGELLFQFKLWPVLHGEADDELNFIGVDEFAYKQLSFESIGKLSRSDHSGNSYFTVCKDTLARSDLKLVDRLFYVILKSFLSDENIEDDLIDLTTYVNSVLNFNFDPESLQSNEKNLMDKGIVKFNPIDGKDTKAAFTISEGSSFLAISNAFWHSETIDDIEKSFIINILPLLEEDGDYIKDGFHAINKFLNIPEGRSRENINFYLENSVVFGPEDINRNVPIFIRKIISGSAVPNSRIEAIDVIGLRHAEKHELIHFINESAGNNLESQ